MIAYNTPACLKPVTGIKENAFRAAVSVWYAATSLEALRPRLRLSPLGDATGKRVIKSASAIVSIVSLKFIFLSGTVLYG